MAILDLQLGSDAAATLRACWALFALFTLLTLRTLRALRAWDALLALIAFITLVAPIASGLANVGPSGALVVRDIPLAVVDLELRGDAIVAIGSILAIRAIVARRTSEALPNLAAVVADVPVAALNLKLGGGAVLAISAILAVGTRGGNLVALRVGEPLAVQRPIVGTVVGLGYADRGGVAVSTIGSVGSVGSIGAVVDGDGVGLSKGDCVTYDSPPLKIGTTDVM